VRPHPVNHFQNFLRVPRPKIQPGQQTRRIARARVNIIVDEIRFRPGRLNREGVEAHLFHEKLKQAMLHFKKLFCAMRCFSQCDDARIADDWFERH